MKILVDSHAFLWAVMAPDKLGAKARSELTSGRNEVFLSAISLWEISLKYSLGKLDLKGVFPADLPDAAGNAGFETLPLDPQLAASFHELPKLAHKDPFDRMLIWQCIRGGFTLVSKDKELASYKPLGLELLW